MVRRTNAIVDADEQLDDELAGIEAEDERDEEVDETAVLDADDMYDIDAEDRAPAGRPPGKSKTTGKGKGTKAASKTAKDDEWVPANTLDAPPPRPGMKQRWVRHLAPGSSEENDAKNWTRAMREGWRPRAVNTVPDGYDAPTSRHATMGTIICVGDLVLCEMPLARYKARQKYFREKRERMMASIKKQPLAQAEAANGPRIVVQDKADVSFGRRRARATDED